MPNKPTPNSILDGFLNSDDPGHRRYMLLSRVLLSLLVVAGFWIVRNGDRRVKLCQSGPGVFLNGTKVACVEYPPRRSCAEGELLVTAGEEGTCSVCVWRFEGRTELRDRLQARDFQQLDPVDELVCLESEGPELPR